MLSGGAFITSYLRTVPTSAPDVQVNIVSCLGFIEVGTVVSPAVFARHCLSYLMCDMPQQALNDAVQAQFVSLAWPTASSLSWAALLTLGIIFRSSEDFNYKTVEEK
ncbi:hypothetical protein MRB53_032457 [Persea americana]|uniref:Uncharacterized protein n=1 Tax=Persea americana TaxID=3435 RepID=A0ACC2KT09_PERAE|nr:hypothetical protein MRB53_032457 [Persea americana]